MRTIAEPAAAQSLVYEQLLMAHRLLAALRAREIEEAEAGAARGSLQRLARLRRQSAGYERSFHRALAAWRRMGVRRAGGRDREMMALIESVAAPPSPPHVGDLDPLWQDEAI